MEDDDGQHWKQPALHRDWTKKTEEHRFLALLAPIEHAKTTQNTIARPLWLLGNNPELRFKIVSSSDDMAKEKLELVKKYITQNERYKEVFPWIVPDPKGRWESHAIFVKRKIFSKDPSIEARGVLTSAEGGRCDWLIGDDVCDMRNTIINAPDRKKVIDTWFAVWMNRLSAKGRCIYVGTPWHDEDLTAELKKREKFSVHSYPINENCDPIWESNWPKERLLDRLGVIGRRIFDLKFRLLTLSDDEKIFNERVILALKAPNMRIADYPKNLKLYAGVDLGHRSKKKKKGETPITSIFTLGVDEDKRKRFFEIECGLWTGPEQAKHIVSNYERNQQEIIMVENNGYQDVIIDWIKVLPNAPAGIPIKAFTTGANKRHLEDGLPGMATEMENGGWMAPMAGHDFSCECNMCKWILELSNYPVGLSDILMSSWLAREGARRGNVTVQKESYVVKPPDMGFRPGSTSQNKRNWYNTKKPKSTI